MNREQLIFMLELLQTQGLAFPLDKCELAVSTRAALVAEIRELDSVASQPDA